MVLAGVVAAIFWVKTKHDAKLLASELNLLEGELSRPVLYGVGIVVAVVIIVASHYLHLKEFANLVFGDKSVGQMAHELEHRGDEMMHGIVQLQKASQQEKDLPDNEEVHSAQKSLRQRLFDAAGAGNTSEVTRLLAEGDAPDGYHSADGESALMRACYFGHTDVVRSLLHNKAHFDLQNEYGESALIMASAKGYSEIVRLLLEIGAKFDLRKQDGGSALMEASKEGYIDVVRLLLEKGANFELKNKDGHTALHLAMQDAVNPWDVSKDRKTEAATLLRHISKT